MEGEEVHPHLSYLPGLSDLIGQTGSFVDTWVREFYASLYVDPGHRWIHFGFAGRDHRLYADRARELLRIEASETRIHSLCYGATEPPHRPHGGIIPETEFVRPCFREPFVEGSRRLPADITF